MEINAKWTGSYPNLCFGHWEILIDDKYLPIPEDKLTENMNTFGTYQAWYFDSHWLEHFTSYSEGLSDLEWIDENKAWIDTGLAEIGKKFESFSDYIALYNAIQENDFRRRECGGCI